MSGPAGPQAGAALLTVIGGYLGAGKTTLINRLLAGTGGGRIAVVVNDFGAVGVDASLIRSRTADTIELTNGCLCCSLTDDLAGVMTGLAAREPRFEHVVVELSGVGQPSAMTAWGWFPGFRPGRTVVCADALTGPAGPGTAGPATSSWPSCGPLTWSSSRSATWPARPRRRSSSSGWPRRPPARPSCAAGPIPAPRCCSRRQARTQPHPAPAATPAMTT